MSSRVESPDEHRARQLDSNGSESHKPSSAAVGDKAPSGERPLSLQPRWVGEVRAAVDAELARFFARKRDETRRVGGEGTVLVEAIAELTMRGGKRLRPAVLHAAHRAVGGRADDSVLLGLSAALELLQSYLLIHDDWMDRDEERRGGPSVHAALRARTGQGHLGDALAILAGDLASAYAWELVVSASSQMGAPRALGAAFARMHQEVVLGQELDLVATDDVSRMQRLKTGSYTVVGPLRLGALAGGASDDDLAQLEAYGEPLGEAFQIRDDLLGTFGEPTRTGKPRGSDLRAGKRTSLVIECERSADEGDRRLLRAVLGRRDAPQELVEDVAAMLECSGVRARVEARLASLLASARAAIAGRRLDPVGSCMLLDLVDALALRDV